jgi:hypothetical protein
LKLKYIHRSKEHTMHTVTYKLNEPRLSVSIWDEGNMERRVREIGQVAAWSEAMMFLALGYTVHVARWNGKCFESTENYRPGDL